VGIRHIRFIQIRLVQIYPNQNRISQIRMGQIRLRQVRICQIRPTEIRPTQIHIPEIGCHQVQIAKIPLACGITAQKLFRIHNVPGSMVWRSRLREMPDRGENRKFHLVQASKTNNSIDLVAKFPFPLFVIRQSLPLPLFTRRLKMAILPHIWENSRLRNFALKPPQG
jgi:hypothetical protein